MGISQTPQALVPASFSSGGMTLISETVASTNSSLSFSSLGNYKQLYLIWSGIKISDSSTVFGLRLNNSSSSIYVLGGHSQRDTTSGYGGSTNSHFSVDVAGVPVTPFGNGSDSTTLNRQTAGEFLIDNYTSTTKSKSVNGCWNFTQGTSPSYFFTGTGFFNSTSAVTTIDIFRLSGSGTFSNDSNTTIRLYGIS
jgi:hypothetical protein